MGKLLGQIFKEDIKSIILWLFLPLAAVMIFSQLINIFNNSALVVIGLVLSGILLVMGPLIALVIMTKNDDKRFYSDNASFYSALPFDASQVTGARYINYILLGLVIIVSMFINFILLMRTQSTEAISIWQIFRDILTTISQMDSKIFFGVVLNLFMIGLAFTAMITFANTAGHLRIFGASKSASAIVFSIIFIIVGYTFSKFQGWIVSDYMTSDTSGRLTVEVAENAPYLKTVILPSLFNLIITAIFYISTFKIHKDKLSVA